MSAVRANLVVLGVGLLTAARAMTPVALAQQVGPVTEAPVLPVPEYPEVGVGVYVPPISSDTGTGTTSGAGTGSPAGTGSEGSALSTLQSQSYGSAAVQAGDQAGVSANAMADIALVESDFQNVGDANGTTDATGPWQVLPSTFNYINQKYDLGLSSSDINNPADEAVVGAYTMKDYASEVGGITGTSPTIVQTYGAYVFGPVAGSQMAGASTSTPLSEYVSSTALGNNGMSGWTVGEFYSTEAAKMGSSAYDPVLS